MAQGCELACVYCCARGYSGALILNDVLLWVNLPEKLKKELDGPRRRSVASRASNSEAMAQCRDLSKEFVKKNIRQAKSLGAKRLVIFCSPCYPIYKHAFPEENIVFYPVAISEVMSRTNFKERIDYYAGCYKLHRKFSPVPMDLGSTDEVFSKIDGLDVHRISAPKCCFTPEGLSHMKENVLTKLMVHICTGCYGQALQSVPSNTGIEVLMLPELVERVHDIVV